MATDLTVLTKEEEETLKKALFDFVIRVSSDKKDRRDIEIQVLPYITELLLKNFVEPYFPDLA